MQFLWCVECAPLCKVRMPVDPMNDDESMLESFPILVYSHD